MGIETQILKGLLESCLLKVIEQEPTYGYKAVEQLNLLGFEVNEATVYPILVRLTNKGFLYVKTQASPMGPERKYYYITPQGKDSLEEFNLTWKRIQSIVNQVMKE
jgi:PadR family transcriptional regulator, regulatory protein PadR